MPCTTNENLTADQKGKQKDALDELRKRIGKGVVKVIIDRNSGAFALKGWTVADREGISDACAYRALANTSEMRLAKMRAESMAGRRMSMVAMMSGVHSHDGGETWGRD